MDLLEIWDRVRWSLPLRGRSRVEAFLEFAHDNPEAIRDMQSRSAQKRQKAFEKLQRHCVAVAEKARRDLARKGWETFATFDPVIAEELEDCAEGTGEEQYTPSQLEFVLREEATGAPF